MKDCILCGASPEYLGCFVVENEPKRYAAVKLAPGKTRTLWYALCSNCFGLPDKARRIEDVFEAAATRGRN